MFVSSPREQHGGPTTLRNKSKKQSKHGPTDIDGPGPYPTDNRQTRLDLGSQQRVEIRNQKYSSRRTQIMAPLDI